MDAWWRWDWAPTPEEWQAFWAFLTLCAAIAAAWVALSQLSATRKANVEAANASKAASQANEAPSLANKAAVRPYVDVNFEFVTAHSEDPSGISSSGSTTIVIQNRGRSAAKNVRFMSDPKFQQSEGDWSSPARTERLYRLREMFSGSYDVGQISPGQRIVYTLDRTVPQMDESNALPQRYKITVSYTDLEESEEYGEVHVMDLEHWHDARVEIDSLEVIARQMRTMNKNTKKTQGIQDRLVQAVEELTDAGGGAST